MNKQSAIKAARTPILFCSEDYVTLDRGGMFARFDKTELIEGVIVSVNAQYIGHGRVQKLLFEALNDACRAHIAKLEAYFEISVRLSAYSVPQPDLVLVGGLPADGLLAQSDVRLIVEVADSSLAFDMGDKAALYAAAGVPEYWVADVNGRVIHQMWPPADGVYSERRQFTFGAPITAATIPGLTVATDRLA